MRKTNRKSEDSLNLMLSQDDTERRMQNGLEDDDLHLWLSQSQTAPTQQSMDDTAVSDITSPDNDVQMNVREILNMIRHNHNYMVKQNDVLFKLVREVSVNVSEINDKIRILEKKFSVIEKAVKHNNNEIVEVQHKVENLEKSIRILKEKQSVSVKADELEIRLKAMENKLNQRITERVNTTDVVANASTATTDDRLLLIKNLPYGMKDNEDVVKLIREGMGLDISVKSIQRAPSVYNRAGVLTVELHSKDDKMKILANKSKLRQSIDYYNVYLENTNSAVDMRIEEQIKMLVNNVQNAPSFQYPRASKYTTSRARNNRYHNTQGQPTDGQVANTRTENNHENGSIKLNVRTWNKNGLGKWKIKHKDFIRVLESNNILSISETWMNQTESEIVSRDFSSTHKVAYSCRKRNKKAKRDSGGILVFVKNTLSQYIEVVDKNDEDLLWQ